MSADSVRHPHCFLPAKTEPQKFSSQKLSKFENDSAANRKSRQSKRPKSGKFDCSKSSSFKCSKAFDSLGSLAKKIERFGSTKLIGAAWTRRPEGCSRKVNSTNREHSVLPNSQYAEIQRAALERGRLYISESEFKFESQLFQWQKHSSWIWILNG